MCFQELNKVGVTFKLTEVNLMFQVLPDQCLRQVEDQTSSVFATSLWVSLVVQEGACPVLDSELLDLSRVLLSSKKNLSPSNDLLLSH